MEALREARAARALTDSCRVGEARYQQLLVFQTREAEAERESARTAAEVITAAAAVEAVKARVASLERTLLAAQQRREQQQREQSKEL